MKISSSTIATLAIAVTAIGGSAFAVTLNTPIGSSNESTNIQVVDPLAPGSETIIDTLAPVPPVDGNTPVVSPTPVAPTPTTTPTPPPVVPVIPDIPSFNSDDDDEDYEDEDDSDYEDDDDYGYESEHEDYDHEDDD